MNEEQQVDKNELSVLVNKESVPTVDKLSKLTIGWEEVSKVGSIELTPEQTSILYAPVDESEILIRPDGLIYLPWIFYATRLRKAFGIGWALIPNLLPKIYTEGYKKYVVWGFWLVIKGIVAGFAFGEQEYFGDATGMSWTDACEGAKSNSLMRLCKGIGISLELWDKEFAVKWINKFACSREEWDGEKQKNVTIWYKKPTGSEETFKGSVKISDETMVIIPKEESIPPLKTQGDYNTGVYQDATPHSNAITSKQVGYIKGLCSQFNIEKPVFAGAIQHIYGRNIDNLTKAEGSDLISELKVLGEGFILKYAPSPPSDDEVLSPENFIDLLNEEE
ncbi:MAG: hypothetical protein DDT40_00788 [candidate division WS2 bacterium]|nr:hypothetical protein [Candidatus Psychracetigena formicireducens]